MKEIIIETIEDSVKLLPFLLVVFLIMELIEHKLSKKSKNTIQIAGKLGPFLGSLLGSFPQCGFSVAATNLYAARIITLGTLISIYLSTSDEMLPILISQNVEISLIIKIIGIKVIIGIICGFIIDYVLRKKKKEKEHIHDLCEHDHCNCEKGIIISTIFHTLNIFVFIIIMSFALNTILYYLGEESLGKIFLKDSIFSPFVSSLIGLIPNCGASVVITELYLNGAINFASMMAGLLTGSGVAILVLFKENKRLKENIQILLLIYGIGVLSGVIINLLGMMF